MNVQKIVTQKNKSFLGIKINVENAVLLLFIVLSFTISLLPIQYGYFIDELYAIDLSKHLAWGYIQIPPLMPWGLAITRFLFGESLFAIHILPAVYGVITLIVIREIAKKMGANLLAQVLVLACVLFSPMFVTTHAMVSCDGLDGLCWALCLYALLSLITTENKKYWLYFGVFAGLGLMSKFNIVYLGFGVVVAMFFTTERKYFLTWQFWLSGIIALLIFSPYLFGISAAVRQCTLEYMSQYHLRTASLTVGGFIKQQILTMNPLSFPIWALGLYYFLIHKEGKKFRLFGLAYFIMSAACIIQQAKFYVVVPFYPILFVGGAVFIENIIHKFKYFRIVAIIYTVLIVLAGLLLLPLSRPILPPDVLVKYLESTHLFRPGSQMDTERRPQGLLPQHFADRFGWEEMVAKIAQIYYSLPEKQRANTVIITSSYGAAGAVNLYGKKYHLSGAISPYLQHYIWGYKNLNQDSTLIVKGYPLAEIKKSCKEVKLVGEVYSKYAMPDGSSSTGKIYLCRGFKKPVSQIWEQSKNMRM